MRSAHEYLDFIEAYLQSFSLNKLANLNQQTLHQYAFQNLDKLLKLNHDKTKQQRWQFFQIPNTEPDDYQEHIVSLDSSH